jgi:bifunctional non-homologous end joining protein LigD
MNGVTLTNPDRVFWPLDRITKRDLAAYYDRVAPLMLPHVLGRPLSMVRCPGGLGELPAGVRQGRGRVGECFFHKHPGDDFPGPFTRISITESGGPAPYLAVSEAASLTALAQMGTLEIHVWGSTWPDIERPDVLVFDLDPDPAVDWPALAGAARLVREVLRAAGLESFVKTTGGKGLHVTAPVTPNAGWDEVRLFCRQVAEAVVEQAPDRLTANMSKAKRTGKIYIDYVRNNRGATSIAPYSTRARERAPVAVPLRWTELSGQIRPDTFTVSDLAARLSRLKGGPWEGYFETKQAQSITAAETPAGA